MNRHLDLIDNLRSLREMIHQLQNQMKKQGATPQAPMLVGLDTEFIRETTFYPQLELIQISTDKDAWLVDFPALEESSHESLDVLKAFLQDPCVLKIIHAALGDEECLFTSMGCVASPILDTAVAASLVGYGDAVGLGNLMKSCLGVTLKKGHARTHWHQRPLPLQLREYALADVEHMVELGRVLIDRLDGLQRREWALELSREFENEKMYQPNPEDIAEKLYKGGRVDEEAYGVLVELVRWRETRVRELNVPRRRLADDGVLLDLARVRPKDLEHLASFRGMNRGEIRGPQGQRILEAMKRGQSLKGLEPPKFHRYKQASSDENRLVDFLRSYVALISDQHKIAPTRLLSGNDYLALIRTRAKTPEEWVSKGVMSQAAAAIIGDEVLAFLKGERALSLRDNAIHVVNLTAKS